MISNLTPLPLEKLPKYYLISMSAKMTKSEKKILGHLSSVPKCRRDLELETKLGSNVIYKALIKLAERGYANIYEGRPNKGKERLTRYFTISETGTEQIRGMKNED